MATTHAHDISLTDSHASHGGHDGHDQPADPNAAPTRSDVRDQFSAAAVLYCALLGAIAIVAGTVLGFVVINN